ATVLKEANIRITSFTLITAITLNLRKIFLPSPGKFINEYFYPLSFKMKFDAKNTISKALIVLIITLSVLIAISIYSLKSYREFTGAVASLSNPPAEAGLTERIQYNVSELESYGRAYYLTSNNSDLENYLREAGT